MAKVGDTVRYLNEIGGGVITRIDGKIAYVDDNGFENPMLIKDLVVVLPAGYEKDAFASVKMFDQTAFDDGRKPATKPIEKPAPKPVVEKKEEPIVTEHGEKLTLTLAFEPSSLKQLSTATFNAVLVNDSNYHLLFVMARQGSDERYWHQVYHGTVEPNELIDLAQLTHAELTGYERIALQVIAFKPDKPFELKAPISFQKKLNLTKFFKLHCFEENQYFDTPVISVPLIVNDRPSVPMPEVDAAKLREALGAKAEPKSADRPKKQKKEVVSDTKLLPVQEIDLHINELTDSTAGMDNTAMLQMQLEAVRKTMQQHRKRIGQKIVFIHGKGEGVLRKAVLALLKKEYPKAELQDASFREYGFGATLVTIH